MSGPQFTPGPWSIAEDAFQEPHPKHAFIWLNNSEAAFVSGHIGKANASLIASAPDMFAALERISENCPPRGEWPDDERDEAEASADAFIGDIARAALAKARGEAR